MSSLPAICAEMRLRAAEDGVPVVNTRDVAEFFGKDHKNVLRDIDSILHGSNLSDGQSGWFREVRSEHPTVAGRLDRSFDMTRQGFTLLVMGWNGERAMQFKVRLIEAFDAMEAALRTGAPVANADLQMAIRELVKPLSVRFDYQDREIGEVKGQVAALAQDMSDVKATLLKITPRRDITKRVKEEHLDAIELMGGRCPCCSVSAIVLNGQASAFMEFDHFFARNRNALTETWPICKPCHSDFSSGRVSRSERQSAFDAYQGKLKRLPGKQITLFG